MGVSVLVRVGSIVEVTVPLADGVPDGLAVLVREEVGEGEGEWVSVAVGDSESVELTVTDGVGLTVQVKEGDGVIVVVPEGDFDAVCVIDAVIDDTPV